MSDGQCSRQDQRDPRRGLGQALASLVAIASTLVFTLNGKRNQERILKRSLTSAFKGFLWSLRGFQVAAVGIDTSCLEGSPMW